MVKPNSINTEIKLCSPVPEHNLKFLTDVTIPGLEINKIL